MWQRKTIFLVLLVLFCSVAYSFLQIGFINTAQPFEVELPGTHAITRYLQVPMNSYPHNITLTIKNAGGGTTDGLAAYYSFDVNGTDNSGNEIPLASGMEATINNSFTSIVGNATYLQTNYFSTATGRNVSYLGDGKTIAFWLYCNDTAGQDLMGNGNAPGDQGFGIYHGTDQKVQLRMFDGPPGSTSILNDSNPITIHSWNHFTFLIHPDNNSMYMLRNTTQVDNGTFDWDYLRHNTFEHRWTVGRFGSANFFIGSTTCTIDELYIYNRTIEHSEIEDIYENRYLYPSSLQINNISIYTANQSKTDVVIPSNASLNISWVNSIINNRCTCENCNIADEFCQIPISFDSSVQGTISVNVSKREYQKQVFLIDEIENTGLNMNNITGAKLYYDENNSFHDFKTTSTNVTNITVINNKLRLSLEYQDGSIITRYIDTDLVPADIRICANKEGTTHYEQLILSSTEREALLYSVFPDCYVAADFTRFGYQTDYLLKAYTIDTQYVLYVYQDGVETRLIGIDGSVQAFMNLDTIELSQTPYSLDIVGDGLNFQRLGNTSMQIYYKNEGIPNTGLSLDIKRLDTNAVIFSTNDFDDLNEFTLTYDYSTEAGINSTAIFLIELTKTNSEGTSIIKRYFNNVASSGIIPAGIAIAASILMTIFGLTFTTSRQTLSYFGIFILAISIGVLTLSVSTWYITFMMVIDLICLVYSIIILMTQNYKTVLT